MTSGGDAPGMNAAVRAVVRKAIYHGLEVVGIQRGYYGLLKKEFIPLNLRSVGDIIQRGGTMLRTARCEEFKHQQGVLEGVQNIQEQGIEGLTVIGGTVHSEERWLWLITVCQWSGYRPPSTTIWKELITPLAMTLLSTMWWMLSTRSEILPLLINVPLSSK